MVKGQIISCSSNLYIVQAESETIECNIKGKFKQIDEKPIVGDFVEIEKLQNEEAKGVICRILPRKSLCKRPKIANLDQIILVVSLKTPKPDFLLLDKKLDYIEYLGLKPIICINKIDLGSKEAIENIHKIYGKIGYTVINTNAKEGKGINEIEKNLKGRVTALSGNSGVRKIYFNKCHI